MAASPAQTTSLSRVLLEANPSPMTLEGTNTWILQAPGAEGLIVVDPGQLTISEELAKLTQQTVEETGHDEQDFVSHVDVLAELPVELILLTHFHFDHAEAAPELARRTGAPVRALDPTLSSGAPAFVDGEVIRAAGVAVEVVHTPGHTADSVCFYLPEDGPHGSMITGDMILGRGTTVLGPEKNSLGAFLSSMERLRGYGEATVLTGHGPILPSLVAISEEYLAHRHQRLDQVRATLDQLGQDATAEQIVDVVYAGVPSGVRIAAIHSVVSQLEYLRAEA